MPPSCGVNTVGVDHEGWHAKAIVEEDVVCTYERKAGGTTQPGIQGTAWLGMADESEEGHV